jgi:hypothetical protein
MIEALLGSIDRERVLLFLYCRREGYAREISRFFDTEISQIQKQLQRLQSGRILSSRTIGKIKLFNLNSTYPLREELEILLQKLLSLYPAKERDRLTMSRHEAPKKDDFIEIS